ncbi:MAG: hypothetical protein PVH88_21105 [Ignavibacteria bacterium]|jgi:hypothetical protein
MRVTAIILLLIPFLFTNAQKIGELAPKKPPEQFPPNSWGVDLMFGEGGFGLGTFLRKEFTTTITGFVDLGITESKDEREVEIIDPYFGTSYTLNKKNRVFLVPVNFGVQYRLFHESITDNLRPYFSFGVGPTLVFTTPYDREFFSAFAKAQTKYAAGGYVGLGANFGLSKDNLVGINARYYIAHLFDEGVENLYGKFRKDLNHFYLTLNIGLMY